MKLDPLDKLGEHTIIVMFCGKGGVGKTTCASSTAIHCADRGHRTLLVSTDPAPSLTDILEVVTRHLDVRLADLQSKPRSQSITMPRQICRYLARSLTTHSLEEIGGHLGGRDHTTVMHACNKIAEAVASDAKMQALLGELSRQVAQGQPVQR